MHRDSGNIYAEFEPILGKPRRWPAPANSRRPAVIAKLGLAGEVTAYFGRLEDESVSENGTRAIVRELYDAYGRRDFERVAALIHDDIDWIIYAPMLVFPFAGPRHGRAAVLAAMAAIAKTFALERYQSDVMIVDGERAALMSDISYRQRATNRVLRLRIASFLRWQDGRLIEYREFTNSFDAVEQALGRELQL